MMKKTVKGRNKDRGSATLVTGIISVMFLCICAGWAIDVAKNAYLKSSLNSRAQQATQVAVKDLSPNGSLKETAPSRFVKEYIGADSNSTSHGDETKAFSTVACNSDTVHTWNGDAEVQLPYIEVRMDSERQVGTTGDSIIWASQNGVAPEIVSGVYDPTEKYHVIAATVHDSSTNLMLSIVGIPCQSYTMNVSAITFGSAEDVG